MVTTRKAVLPSISDEPELVYSSGLFGASTADRQYPRSLPDRECTTYRNWDLLADEDCDNPSMDMSEAM